jgi:hypothetical protein
MRNGQGQLVEIYLDSRSRITCPPDLIPAPGQYILAHASGSDSPLGLFQFSSATLPRKDFALRRSCRLHGSQAHNSTCAARLGMDLQSHPLRVK